MNLFFENTRRMVVERLQMSISSVSSKCAIYFLGKLGRSCKEKEKGRGKEGSRDNAAQFILEKIPRATHPAIALQGSACSILWLF